MGRRNPAEYETQFDLLVTILCTGRLMHPPFDPQWSGILNVNPQAFYLFSFLRFFDSELGDDHPQNFYTEREWRSVGNLDFSLADVCRVFLPSGFEGRLRAEVPGYQNQITAF